MLQQTQVATVIGYFERFVKQFSTIQALASAEADQVMALWAGLGYYSRARNLHRAAQICVEQHGGSLPREIDLLIALPGIGRSTAAAILAQSFGDRHAILDGNVKRVLTRFHGIEGWPGKSAIERSLWQYAESHTPTHRVAEYTQAIMDLGATVCSVSKPQCSQCPLRDGCFAHTHAQQATLPTRKPRKSIPLREAWLLFQINHRGELLLERRPPSGIWGGLWSLPMTETRPQASKDAQAKPIRHTFTHFKLDLKPLRVQYLQVTDRDTRWCDQQGAAQLGLPQPIRQLVDQHFEDQLQWQTPSTV